MKIKRAYLHKVFLFCALLLPIGLVAQQSEDHKFKTEVADEVLKSNAELEKLQKSIQQARMAGSPDTTKLGLRFNEELKRNYSIPQEFIRRNPNSVKSVIALGMLGNGAPGMPVSRSALMKLFEGLSEDVKQSKEGQAYKARLGMWEAEGKDYSTGYSSIPRMEMMLNGEAATGSLPPEVVKSQLARVEGRKVALRKTGTATEPLARPDAAERLKRSTLIVNMSLDQQGQRSANPASGYVLDGQEGICVTNYHVLQEYSRQPGYVALSVTTAEGRSYPVVDVLSVSPVNDLALLKADLGKDVLEGLPIGEFAPVGTQVYASGHPNRHFYLFTEGIVSANYTESLPSFYDGQPHPVMCITADFASGSSGGPVVDACCNLVGTISRTALLFSDPVRQQGFQMSVKKTVPVVALKELIEFKI